MNEPKTRTIEGLVFSAQELSPFTTIDLLAEFAESASVGFTSKDNLAMASGILKNLGAARLRDLLPRLLQSISTTVHEGGKPQRLTLGSIEAINVAFAGRMKVLPQVVAFALEVSFADFLAGIVLAAKSVKDRSSSKDSSPST